MINPRFISAISIFLISYFPTTLAQQPYIRQATASCDTSDNSTSVLGYTCNGPRPTCQAYLTFRAQPPYTSVATISTLLSVDSAQLAQLNSVPQNTTFQTNQTVLIPVTCSCSGQHYQFNASYVIQPNDTYLAVASSPFQGLSTCQALQTQNTIPATDLFPGAGIAVPLRCACPTRNQTGNGVNYLLSYLITWNQFVSTISQQFGVSTVETLAANGLSESDVIYPFTTLLIPLRNPPTRSQVTAPQPPPPPSATTPPLVPPPPRDGGSSKTWIYAVAGVVGGLFIVVAVIFCLFFRKKKKQKKAAKFLSSQGFESVEKPSANESGEGEDSLDFLESISSIAQSLKVYTFEELKASTEDFSPNCWIKGSVYRGTIEGDLAAIKKINGDVSKEINLLNKINHFNLIRLSGVGFNKGNWYLVYEYASNGSLNNWIFDTSEEKHIMNWNRRLQIALDIAAGLNYLHRYTSPPHVHKDLNSTNVLLDRDFRAKIANFGLARSAEGQEGQFALTRHIVGTKGYMAPEYLESGIVSPKLDVYAFGVLLLEILTGKEVSLLSAGVSMQLSEILTPVFSEDDDGKENLRNLMDPMLGGKYPEDLAVVLFGLIGKCLKKDPSDRPNMDGILKSLSRISNSSVPGEWAISISELQTRPR